MKKMLAAAMLVSLLAACTEASEDSPTTLETTGSAGPVETGTPEPSGTPTSEPEETSEPGETSEPATAPETVDVSDFTVEPTSSDDFPELLGQYLPLEARVGGHEEYDRVVVEYDDGAGQLGWSASYEDAAIEDGSGLEVDMAGEQFLTITVSGVRYPTEAEAADPFPITGLDQSAVIADVHVDYPFEGMHMIFIGLDEQHPYRVQVFDSPLRIVVDILHD